MPLGIINTNVSSDSIPITFCEDLSKLLSEILEMPEEVVTVHLNANQTCVRNGSHGPNAYIELYHSKGYGTIENRRKVSQAILDYAKQHLKITDDSRIFLLFKQPPGQDIGLVEGLWSDFNH